MKSYIPLTKVDQRLKISSQKHKSSDLIVVQTQRFRSSALDDLSPKCDKGTKESKHTDNKLTMYNISPHSNIPPHLTDASILLDATDITAKI